MKFRKLKSWKYQLTEPFHIAIGFHVESIETEFISLFGCDLFLKRYYAWDGASGPFPDVASVMKGSLVHDALCQLIQLGLLDPSYRKLADLEFKRICLQSGMPRFWAQVVYLGVWIGSIFSNGPHPMSDSKVYELL